MSDIAIVAKMAEDEGLSIEETNKLRLSLGLKPLNVGPGESSVSVTGTTDAALTSQQQEQQAVENLRRLQETQTRERQTQAAQDRLKKTRDRIQRDAKLAGSTLGDAPENEEDTLSWIKRTKQKKRTEPSHPPKKFAVKDYDARELDGIRVAHDINDIDGGDDVILTLQDTNVLEDDANDELINSTLLDRDRLKSKLDSKKRKSVYAGFEDEDNVDSATPNILARYDEDIDARPVKKAGFQISANGVPTSLADKPPSDESRHLVSLDVDMTEQNTISDYAAPIKIKPKKKRQKAKTLKLARDEDEMSVEPEIKLPPQKKILEDVDEDLQALLARRRRIAAQQKALEYRQKTHVPIKQEEESPIIVEKAGLVLDDSTEFTTALQSIKAPEPKLEVRTRAPAEDHDMEDVQQEEGEVANEPRADISRTGIEAEPTLDRGIGAAVAALRQKGALKEETEDDRLRQQKEAWIAKDRKLRLEMEIQRNRLKEDLKNLPRFRNMSTRDREAYAASENKRLDALEAKLTQERFKDYKPNVEIKYVDDFGRNMSQKEAFKHMSHQFHGKDSGSGKSAKKLAQVEKERLNQQKSLFK